MPVIEYGPITANENEQPTLRKIDRALENSNRGALLISSDGEQIQLPPSLFLVLKRIVPHLTHGRAVTIVPINKEVTTQEAADILNVSRPYLVKLLEQGDIPFIKIGAHRRIRLDDLIEYKERRDAEQDKALAELTQLSQDLGLYD
jgi:excisionase family DNA binding protein